LFVEGDQATIEGFIVKCIERDAVGGIGTTFFIFTPRDDVAGNDKLGEF